MSNNSKNPHMMPIDANLRQYRFRLNATCPHCQYSGLMGWDDFQLPIRKPLLLALLIPLAMLGIIPAVICFLVVQRKKRYAVHCPNCLRSLALKSEDVQEVKSAWGGAQYFDANGGQVSNGTVVGRAGKWVLVGIAAFGALAAFVVIGGIAVQKAGLVKTADSAAAPDQPMRSSRPVVPRNDRYVSAVREGVMAGYNTTTIGKAFEATFTDGKWQSGETNKGVRLVEFTGKLPQSAYQKPYSELISIHRDCAARWGDTPEHCVPVPDEKTIADVRFQFTFSADGQTFELSYIDPAHWSLILSAFPTDQEILGYVYR